jgi:hypothetical protein
MGLDVCKRNDARRQWRATTEIPPNQGVRSCQSRRAPDALVASLDHLGQAHDEKGKVSGAVVQHDSAAVHFPKVSGWRRYVGRLMRKGAA